MRQVARSVAAVLPQTRTRLRARAGSSGHDTTLRHRHRKTRRLLEQNVEMGQKRPAAHHKNAALDDVGAQLGRSLLERELHALHDA